MLGNAFVNDLLTSRLRYGQLNALLLCRSLLRIDAERGDTAPGVRASARGTVLETSSNWTIAKFFSKKLLGLSVSICYGKKAAKRVCKLLNIVLKSRSCVWDAGADGSGWWMLLRPATNKPAYGKHWRSSVGVATVLEHTERAEWNASGEGRFSTNRSQMVSSSRADKKSVRDNSSNKNKIVWPNILGRLLIYLGGPPR